MRYLATVEYKGTNYKGWERQPNQVTIQETIENCLSKLYNEPITIYGSGRTDAGVHALGQTFTFDETDKFSTNELIYKLNCLLPRDIKILNIQIVSDDFHARFSAKKKVYKYLIKNVEKSPFDEGIATLYKENIDLNLLENCLKLFEGKHCFKNFTSKEEDEDNFIRTIYKIDINKDIKNIEIVFTGDGFMRYQIRFMIGTALAVSGGKIGLDFVKEKLNSNERQIVNYKADSDGLYLLQVLY